MQTQITFQTDAFPPVANDTINAPNRYGKKLATWLAGELPKHGITVNDCYAEDWGWEIAIDNPAFPLYLGCGNLDDGGFACFITPDTPTIRLLKHLFRKTDTRPAIDKLATALDAILRSHPRISVIVWQDKSP